MTPNEKDGPQKIATMNRKYRRRVAKANHAPASIIRGITEPYINPDNFRMEMYCSDCDTPLLYARNKPSDQLRPGDFITLKEERYVPGEQVPKCACKETGERKFLLRKRYKFA